MSELEKNSNVKKAMQSLLISSSQVIPYMELTDYEGYPDKISETMFRKFAEEKNETVFSILKDDMPFTLSWSHYLQLMRIENVDERSFYEIEAVKSNWSVRTLQRQYNSSLYERIALSREKSEVMRLATEGNIIEKPQDIIKQPTVLEFLGLEEKSKYQESDLETALINGRTAYRFGNTHVYLTVICRLIQ